MGSNQLYCLFISYPRSSVYIDLISILILILDSGSDYNCNYDYLVVLFVGRAMGGSHSSTEKLWKIPTFQYLTPIMYQNILHQSYNNNPDQNNIHDNSLIYDEAKEGERQLQLQQPPAVLSLEDLCLLSLFNHRNRGIHYRYHYNGTIQIASSSSSNLWKLVPSEDLVRLMKALYSYDMLTLDVLRWIVSTTEFLSFAIIFWKII